MTQGTADIVEMIERDLQAHDELVGMLPGGTDAIYESYPAEETDEPVAVILWVVSSETTPGRDVHTKSWRIQATVKSSRSWRERQSSGGVPAMQRIMDAVHDRLDLLDSYREVGHGSEGGSDPEPMDDGWLAIANDWRISGFYGRERRPSRQ